MRQCQAMQVSHKLDKHQSDKMCSKPTQHKQRPTKNLQGDPSPCSHGQSHTDPSVKPVAQKTLQLMFVWRKKHFRSPQMHCFENNKLDV